MRQINFQACVDYLIKKRKAQISAVKNRKTGKQYQAHICAILDKKSGAIIGIGSNRHYSQSKTMYGTIHAETDALTRHSRKLGRNKVNLLVVRVTGGNSKPCSDCVNNFTTRFTNVNRVYYTNIQNGQFGLSYDNVSQLKSDPEMHTTSFYNNQTTCCMCKTCTGGEGTCIDADEDDDEAKASGTDAEPALRA